MKHACLPCLVAVCFCLTTAPLSADDKPPTIEMKYLDETPRQQSLRKVTEELINKELPAMAWEDASLSEVLEDLEEASGIPFEIQWAAAELVGIDQDSLIFKFKTKDQSLKEALPGLLAQVDADAFDDDKLGFAIRDGSLVISTRRETKAITVKRAYNIGPLLREPYRPVGLYFSDDAFEDTVAYHAWLRGERHAPLTDAVLLKIYKYYHELDAQMLKKLDPDNVVKPQEPPGQGGGGLFADEVFERPEPNEFVQPMIEELVEMIQSSAGDEDDWLEEHFKIYVNSDILVIRTSLPVHAEIQTLLDTMLQAELDRQTAMLKDAHASQQVAAANKCLKEGDKRGAMEHVNQALWIMPDHVPANAMKQLLEGMADKPKPVG